MPCGNWSRELEEVDMDPGGAGEFVYHCHLGDHENDGMMRPSTRVRQL
jgi:FtsP/CotA-like multicopper oxidase with cupredoxin domain